MPLRFVRLDIPDVVLVEPTTFEDERGFFAETYRQSEFAAFGIPQPFVQDAHSRSAKGVLRGLHYQKEPRAQAKLVRALLGEVFDVAVDIRRSSPTYGKWVGVRLSAENKTGLYIPPGFAHGFCAMSAVAELLYKTTDEHAPQHERGIVWNDPDLGIPWPIAQPKVSARDASLPRARDADNNF
jgi:dTDP-4-dehydrorhamnose 3,5-epimerase